MGKGLVAHGGHLRQIRWDSNIYNRGARSTRAQAISVLVANFFFYSTCSADEDTSDILQH
jgi:hypothetical protein